MGEWNKLDEMIVHQADPYNAEPPRAALDGMPLTPLDAFYGRNHGSIQQIDPDAWRLTVDGMVDTPFTLTYQQLTSGFTAHSVVATLACAGNRRAELLKVRPIPGKDPWAHGAISSAEWRGARLADVLDAAGAHHHDGLHIAFAAPDVAPEAVPVQPYGSSIPLSKAMSAEVLLAWEMNCEPLPRAHGPSRRYFTTSVIASPWTMMPGWNFAADRVVVVRLVAAADRLAGRDDPGEVVTGFGFVRLRMTPRMT